MGRWLFACIPSLTLVLVACSPTENGGTGGTGGNPGGGDSPGGSDDAPACVLDDAKSVQSVYDGDTLTVTINSVNERIRVLGIDTPEMSTPPEPCAEAAKAFLQAALDVPGANHSRVALTYDSACLANAAECRDYYDRLLAYVTLPDCTDLSTRQLELGYAEVYLGDTYDRRQEYLAVEAEAEAAGVGIHGAGCL